jgi:hypothetical protein
MPWNNIGNKPSEESEFNSPGIRDLFKRAGMKNPSSTPWEVDLIQK